MPPGEAGGDRATVIDFGTALVGPEWAHSPIRAHASPCRRPRRGNARGHR